MADFDNVDWDAELKVVQAERAGATPETGPEIDPGDPASANVIQGYINNGKSWLHGTYEGARNLSNRMGEDLGARWKIGEDVVIGGRVGFKAFAGSVTDAEALAFQQRGEAQRLRLLVQMNKTGKDLETKLGPFSLPLEDIVGTGAEMAPYMLESLKEAGYGAAQGAATGGAIVGAVGAGVGGIFGGPAGAAAAGAEAAGMGAALGAPIGAKMGAVNAVFQIETGNKYLELINQGLDPNVARFGAASYGVASSAMEVIGLQGFIKYGQKVAGRVFAREVSGKLVPMLGEFVKTLGLEVGVEVLQETASAVTDWMLVEVKRAQAVINAQAGRPLDAALDLQQMAELEKQVTNEAILKRLSDTMEAALKGVPVLTLGSAAAGSVAGKAGQVSIDGINKVFRQAAAATEAEVDTMAAEQAAAEGGSTASSAAQVQERIGAVVAAAGQTLQAGIKYIQEGVQSGQVTPEQVQAVADMPMSDTLDQVTSALFDENGNVNAPPVELDASQPGPTNEQIAAADTGVTVSTGTPDVVSTKMPPYEQGGEPVLKDVVVVKSADDALALKQVRPGDCYECAGKSAVQGNGDFVIGAVYDGRDYLYHAVVERPDGLIYDGTYDRWFTPEVWQEVSKFRPIVRMTGEEVRAYGRSQGFFPSARRLGLPEKASEAVETVPDDVAKIRAELQISQSGVRAVSFEAVDANISMGAPGEKAKNAVKEFRRGVREGKAFTQEMVKAMQKEMTTIIRKSGIPQTLQGQFITDIYKVQTPAQLDKAMDGRWVQPKDGSPAYYRPGIDAAIEHLLNREAVNAERKKIESLLKQAQLKKSAKPVGKFDADTQALLGKIEAYIGNHKLREAARDAFDADPDSPDAVENLAIAAATEGYNDDTQTAQQAEKLRELLAAVIDKGRTEARQRAEAKAEQYQRDVQTLVDSIQGSRPYNPREKIPGIKKNIRDLARGFFDVGETWKGLMQLISSDDTSHAAIKLLDPTEAREDYHTLHDEWQQRTADRMLKIAKGMKKRFGQRAAKVLSRKLAADAKEAYQGDYLDPEGNRQELVLSKAQMRDYYMKFQAARAGDENVYRSLREGNKFTFREDVPDNGTDVSTEQRIEDALDETDLAIVQANFDSYEDLYNNVLNPYWRKTRGTDLPKSVLYSPILREGFEIKDDTTLLQHFAGTGSISPSAVMKRTGSVLPIAPQDDIATLTRHIEKVVRFVAYDGFDQQSLKLLNNPTVRTLLLNKYGQTTRSLIMTHRQDITTGQAKFADIAWNFVDNLRKKTAMAYVGGKLAAIPKQATAMLTALDRVGPIAFTKAFFGTTLRPLKAIQDMNKSATFRALLRASDRDVAEVLKDQKQAGHGEGLLGLFLIPVRVGVWMGAAVSGKAVYDKALKETGSEREALLEMNRFLGDTQQSAFVENQSALERGSKLGKLITMFSGDPLQGARQIIRANRGILADAKNPKAYLRALRSYAVFHLMVPVAFQLMVNALDGQDDPEDDWNKLLRTAILGPWGQIGLLGDALNYAMVRMQNILADSEERAYEPNHPVVSVLTNLGKAIGDETRAVTQEDDEAHIRALHEAAKASPLLPAQLGGGLPWPEVAKWLFPKDSEKDTGTPGI